MLNQQINDISKHLYLQLTLKVAIKKVLDVVP